MISVLHRSIVNPLSPCPNSAPTPASTSSIRSNNQKPWHPVRIVRNKRRAFNNGQWYTVEDYYLLLHLGPRPAELPPLRLIDLQLDRA